MQKISAIIITKNEELNIDKCLRSISWCDEIIVLDSGSTDKTEQICKNYTENFYFHEWQGYGPQKQAALLKAKYNWVLSIDADEEVTSELKEEILEILASENNFSGFLIPRKSFYLGKFINHSGWYPDYILRIGNRKKISFSEDIVHEKMTIDGNVGKLKNNLLHYPYRNIYHHFEKINNYSELSAKKMFLNNKSASPWKIIFAPLFAFFRAYFLKKGFLDGYQGFLISLSTGISTYLKYIKLKELIIHSDKNSIH